MKKGILSRIIGSVRSLIKRGLSRLVRVIFGKKSFSLFGIPKGLSLSPEKTFEIFPEEKILLHPPQSIEETHFWTFEKERTLSNGSFMTLQNGMATALGGVLTSEFRLTTTLLYQIQGRPFSKSELFHFSSKRFFPRILETEEKVASLTAHGWQNGFFHWMFEVLPRLGLIDSNRKIFIQNESLFQKESLALLDLSEEQILSTKDYDAIKTPSLLVPSIPGGPTKWGCQFLREKFLPKLKKSAKKKRLYVSRKDAAKRRILNEEEMISLLAKYGFEVVTLSPLSFKEQMELFYNAEAIIGPHGAGFSHLVACDPQTKLLEIFSPGYVNICYWILANCLSLSYFYLLGVGEKCPIPIGSHFLQDPDIEVNLKDLEASLKLMECSS